MKKVILFDFDGVIADTFRMIHSLNKDYHKLSEDKYRELFKSNIFTETKRILNHQTEEDAKRHHDEWFEKYTPALLKQGIFVGMPEAIEELSEDFDMVIISSCESSAIRQFLEKHNLLSYFSDILGSDVHFDKSEKIQMVFDKYDYKNTDCIFVTDTVGDILEAKEKEVPSLVVTWGYHRKEHFLNYDFISFVESPGELPKLVRDYFKD
ncbi:HAD family hydrolase [Candidatus Nomurabacteria bacterium]|nr:HAD family hydrolase [Candidatus Nomurabacteria bacterium]